MITLIMDIEHCSVGLQALALALSPTFLLMPPRQTAGDNSSEWNSAIHMAVLDRVPPK